MSQPAGIPTPIHTRPASPVYEPLWMKAIESYYLPNQFRHSKSTKRPTQSLPNPPTIETSACSTPLHASTKKKRIHCKVACVYCKKTSQRCEDVRPCSRCVRLGIADECVDAPRKPRIIQKRPMIRKKFDDKSYNYNKTLTND
jgi:hypothetical protein